MVRDDVEFEPIEAGLEPTPSSTVVGSLLSLGFWGVLLAAAGLYATAVLSPKLWQTRQLQQQVAEQQWALVAYEGQTEELRQVVQALDSDPQFLAELARQEFDARRADEEVLSVDEGLRLMPHANGAGSRRPRAKTPTALEAWLEVLNQSESLRQTCLLTAGGLILMAFTFLRERTRAQSLESQTTPRSWRRWLTDRYRPAV